MALAAPPSVVAPAAAPVLSAAATRDGSALPTFQPAIRATAPAVVTISTAELTTDRFFGDQRVERGSGSGVIFDPTGYVLTNAHVVGFDPRQPIRGDRVELGVDRVNVGLPDGTLYQGQVLALDPLTDLAVVKILSDRQFPAAALGDSNSITVGDWVIAIGQPFEFPQTVTAGIISALARENLGGPSRIQTDAAINPGSSGGPLINLRGEVIGINELIVSPSQTYAGLSFAIPVDAQTKQLIATMRAGRPVERGYLGFESRPVGEAVRKVYGVTGGAMVTGVIPDGPAGTAGIRALDVITSMNGAAVRTQADLTRTMEQTAPGQTLRLGFVRRTAAGFQTMEREVRVGSGGMVLVRAPVASSIPGPLGVDARELKPEWMVQTNGTERVGVGVYEVDPLGVGGLAGLRSSDFILAVNGQEVHSLTEYNRIMAGLRAGDAAVLYVRRWAYRRIGGQSRDIVIEVPAVGQTASRG